MRRLDLEQERQAVHVLNAYVKAMGGGKSRANGASAPLSNGASAPPGGKRVSGSDLLSIMSKRTA